MRRQLILPLCLLTVLGCDGRYLLGNVHQNDDNSGGSSGNPVNGASGSTAASGATGNAGGGAAAGSSASSNAGDSGDGGSAPAGLSISPSSVPRAALGGSYLVTFGANGGMPDYSFALLSGTLPAGLSLAANGRLSGTPTETGAFSFTVQVTDATDAQAQASFQLQVSRSRWLASETFISSASTQTQLSLVDLQDPEADPVVLDSQTGYSEGFSGDGRWLVYDAGRTATQADVYLLNLAGDRPGQPELLFTTTPQHQCKFAPDSSKLVCMQDAGSADAPVTNVVYFDTSQAAVGPEMPITKLPPRGAGEPEGSERELLFVDSDTLVYSYGPNDFARVEWHGQTLGQPQPLGVGGGVVFHQSPDGGRATIKRIDPMYPVGHVMVDFRLGEVQSLDGFASQELGISDSFETAFGLQPPAAGDTDLGTYLYYSVNGLQITPVGQEPVVAGSPVAQASVQVARTVVRMKGDRVLVTRIGASSFTDYVVPGDYQNVTAFAVDPTESWLYIGTVARDAQQAPIAATAEQWLSRLQAGVPSAAQLIGQGYLVSTVGDLAIFSPDGQRLVLHGYDTQSKVPVAFHWFDLTLPDQVQDHAFDLPLNWAESSWSADSTYLSFIGGSPDLMTRPLFVVDTLAPDDAPRLITECGSNPAPKPTCPAVATFQP